MPPDATEDVPDWVPDNLRRYWSDGALRAPPNTTVPLGDVPAGAAVRIHVQRRHTQIHATSAGNRAVLILSCDPGAEVAVSGFRVVHLEQRMPRRLTISQPTNLHLFTRGDVQLLKRGDHEYLPLGIWLQGGSAAGLTLSQGLSVTAVRGTGPTALTLRRDGHAQEPLLAIGTSVDIRGGLHVEGAVHNARLAVGKGFSARKLVGVCTINAGSVEVGQAGPSGRPTGDVLVEAGSSITATSGSIGIAGAVVGTEAHPVVLEGAPDGGIGVGRAEHCTIRSHYGKQTGTVTVGATSEVRIQEATHIRDHGTGSDHQEPDFQAGSITLTGPCKGGKLEAARVTVGDLTGPTEIVADHVATGAIRSEADEPASFKVSEWIKVQSATALDVTVTGDDAVTVNLGVDLAPPNTRPNEPDPIPDDFVTEPPSVLSTDGTVEPVRIRLTGRVRLKTTVPELEIVAATDVEALWAAGSVSLPKDVHIRDLLAHGDLRLPRGGTLSCRTVSTKGLSGGAIRGPDGDAASWVKADVLSDVDVTCQELNVAEDVTGCALTVTTETTIGGRLAASETRPDPDVTLSGRVTLADVELPLTLEKARGRIACRDPGDDDEQDRPLIPKLTWKEPTGNLELSHDVDQVSVSGGKPNHQLELASRVQVETLAVDGALHVTAVGWKDADIVGPRSILLGDASRLRLKGLTGGSIALAEGAQSASLAVRHSGASFTIDPVHPGTLTISATADNDSPLVLTAGGTDEDHRADSDTAGLDRPRLRLQGGTMELDGTFRHVTTSPDPLDPKTTLHIPRDSVVHELLGRVRFGLLHGQVTGPPPGAGKLRRFGTPGRERAEWVGRLPWVGAWLVAEVGATAELVVTGVASGPEDETGARDKQPRRGVLVRADVTKLEFSELDELEHLEVFSPEPISLERRARHRFSTEAERQANAQKLSRIAELVDGRSVTGSVRSMAMWAAARAHGATTHGMERLGRGLARWLGYGQRPMPALLTLGALVGVLLLGLTLTDLEVSACVGWFGDAGRGGALTGYAWHQHLERVLLAPLSFLRVSTGSGLEPIGCSLLLQVLVTLMVTLPLVFIFLGLRNYLRGPVER